MQPLSILNHLKKDFINYISSKYPFAERGMQDLDQQLRCIMSEPGALFQDPVIQVVRSRKKKAADITTFHQSLQDNLFIDEPYFKVPYIHQHKAWYNIQDNIPTVISTGTGSGKSESFIIPVIDGLLKQGFQNGPNRVGALFLYPMNALVEDQFFRILKYTKGTGIRVGIYNGTFKKPSAEFKAKIIKKIESIDASIDPDTVFVDPQRCETIPHILLTNYKMLEYMLLRSDDQGLFNNMDLRYLTLDEAHIYTGTLGLEIACLLARLRVHLGAGAEHFLPIATSATLMQKTPGSTQDQTLIDLNPTGIEPKEQMRTFFSQLFGVEFPSDQEWLLQDEYEALTTADQQSFEPFDHVDPKALCAALGHEFPQGLHDLAKLYFDMQLATAPDLTVEQCYELWGEQLYPAIERVAKQLPDVILTETSGQEAESVVDLSTAKQRFTDKLGLEGAILEGLLVLCSHAFKERSQSRFPALGLRLHVFSRQEPKMYWTFDKKTLVSEKNLTSLDKPATNFVMCHKCGHQAWGGLYIPTNDDGECGEFKPLPAFYEDHPLDEGEEILFLHHEADIDGALFDKSQWQQEAWIVYGEPHALKARPQLGRANPGEASLIRVVRQSKKNAPPAADGASCPACGATSHGRMVIATPRSGAATDLGIYGASLLTHLDLEAERRLLFFCDNRQETSYLAGFITDRHRRLNLRRAIATFLHEAQQHGDEGVWPLLQPADSHANHSSHKFDFAARILLSIAEGKYWGKQALPNKYEINKSILVDLIPRDVLQVDWRERKDIGRKQIIEYKNWLMDNHSIDARKASDQTHELREQQELFDTDKGQWCLEIFSKVLLIEMTGVIAGESSLLNTGMLAWHLKDFDANVFESYAKDNPALGLSANALFCLAYWMLRKIAARAQWDVMDQYTRNYTVGKFGDKRLADLKTLIGKGLGNAKGLSKNSQVYRIIETLSNNNSKTLTVWSKQETWVHFIEKGPLERFILLDNEFRPLLKSYKLAITPKVSLYKSSRSQQLLCVPADYPLADTPTGKKDEYWQHTQFPLGRYYQQLYQRTFAEKPRLIRGSEHNGMIGAAQASAIIEDFSQGKYNALVATPTLEVGVDLPDLPIVIHRSVPPDPSNYAQRAGRAGRDPKRALLLTYCGQRSHDLVFYEKPTMMVSGEILPPGLPCENESIIKRHIQGLILELLAVDHGDANPALRFQWWGDLVDLNFLANEFNEVTKKDHNLVIGSPQNWRKILQQRKEIIQTTVERYLTMLADGLWKNLKKSAPKRFAAMRRRIYAFATPEAWAASFESEGERYQAMIKAHLTEIATLDKLSANLPMTEREEKFRAIRQLMSYTKAYLQKNTQGGDASTYPLSYLGASGFLPNFDFPGSTTQFKGTLDQGGDAKVALSYARSSSLALREFSPEQRIYGHGFVYQVDRYLAKLSNNEDDNKAWGICTKGCTQLSPPGAEECVFCGNNILLSGQEEFNQPKLVEIEQAMGTQLEVISDSREKRKHNYVTQDVRKIGVPRADEAFTHQQLNGVEIYRHLTPESQIRTVTILTTNDDKKQGIQPVFKEKREGSLYTVKVTISENEKAAYEPFVPTVFGKGQAMILKLPLTSIMDSLNHTAPEEREFYTTFSEIIKRSATRVLHLNTRSRSLNILLDKIASKDEKNNQYQKIDLMFLDSEEGGSGVIDLLWSYWDSILDEAKRLTLKTCCEDSCYECIKSYDNQTVHPLLDKSLLLRDGETPLLDSLKKQTTHGLSYQQKSIDTLPEVDQQSPAEEVFKQFLIQRGINFTTQTSVFDLSGKEITRPDFEIKTPEGETITIFIDGKAYHADYETMLADVEKRNFLSKQGRRVMTLPAGCLVPTVKESLLMDLFNLLVEPCEFNITSIDQAPPFVGIDWETGTNLNSDLLQIPNYKAINKDHLLSALNVLPQTIRDCLERAQQLNGDNSFPQAMQEDMLLFSINGKDVFSDANKKKWEYMLYVQSIYAVLGFRVMGVWLSPRKIYSNVA